VFDNVTNGIKAWLVGLFASAINHTMRPEDRVLAIRWLGQSRDRCVGRNPAATRTFGPSSNAMHRVRGGGRDALRYGVSFATTRSQQLAEGPALTSSVIYTRARR
jgi:hypothetical protein